MSTLLEQHSVKNWEAFQMIGGGFVLGFVLAFLVLGLGWALLTEKDKGEKPLLESRTNTGEQP